MRYAPKLTSRQRVVRFIRAFWSEYHYAPSTQEIAQGLGFGSRNAVIYHLRALRALGGIEWTEGGGRTIRLKEVDVDDDFAELESQWPSLENEPDGVDILEAKFGKPTGAESQK